MNNPSGFYPISKTDVFTRPGDTTAYAAGDRIGATVSDTGTTALRSLFTCRQYGAAGVIERLTLIASVSTFIDIIRLHLFTKAAPTTVIPGDNVAMGIVYTNVGDYLGYVDFGALAEPVAAAASDVSMAILNNVNIRFQTLTTDKSVYYALQTLGTGTPGASQSFTLRVEGQEA